MSSEVTSLGLYLMRRRARQTLRWCQAKSILEIGPGRGVLAGEALAAGVSYSAIDQDPAVLQRLPAGAATVCRRVPPLLPADGRRVDAVVAEAVLEHMPDYATAAHFVRSCRSALQPGGRLVLRFPEIRFSRFAFWEFPPDHEYVTSLPRVCTLVEQNGFEIVRSGYFVDCFCGPAAHLAWWLIRLLPTRILQTLVFWGTGARKNIWSKIGEKAPQAYILARRIQ